MCEAVNCKLIDITSTGYSTRFNAEEGLTFTIKVNNNTISKLTHLYALLHKTVNSRHEFLIGCQLPIDASQRDDEDSFDLSSKNFWVAKKGRDVGLISIPGFSQSISVNLADLFKSIVYIYDQMFGSVPMSDVSDVPAMSLVDGCPAAFDVTLLRFPNAYGIVSLCSSSKRMVIQHVHPAGYINEYARMPNFGVTEYELDADDCWVNSPSRFIGDTRLLNSVQHFKLY